MENQTSFKPKNSLAKDAVSSGEPISIFTMLATIIFFLSLLFGVGVYFYKIILVNGIKSDSASLERAQKAFEPSLITEFERLNKRIESAKEILGNHIIVTPIFKLLENSTIPDVRFNKFNYENGGGDKINISLDGEARSYAHVAVQSDVLGKNKYLKEHVFSNLNLDNFGNVTFNLSATLDQTLILYKDALLRAEGGTQ